MDGDGGGQTTFAQAAWSPNDNPWRIDYGKIMSVYVADWESKRRGGVLNRPDDKIMCHIYAPVNDTRRPPRSLARSTSGDTTIRLD